VSFSNTSGLYIVFVMLGLEHYERYKSAVLWFMSSTLENTWNWFGFHWSCPFSCLICFNRAKITPCNI